MSQAIGGMCRKKCVSCEYDETTKSLTIHTSRKGNVQQTQTAGGTAEEQESVYENISYDDTLFTLSDKLCPKCGTPTRVWLAKSRLYVYVCPTCHARRTY